MVVIGVVISELENVLITEPDELISVGLRRATVDEKDITKRPLYGVKVLEIATILAIPSCAVHLSDMGAEVIKVESLTGDPHRYGIGPILPNESKGFTVINRGKRSISLDLGDEKATEIIRKLVEQSDVVLLSLKLADLQKFGLRYEDLNNWNPSLIYLEHAPYGPKGPFSQEGGYDVVAAGMSGLASILARDINGVPSDLTPAVADVATGLASALAVVTALLHRNATGEGQKVSTSLLQTSLILAGNQIHWFAATDPPAWERVVQELAEGQAKGAGFDEQRTIFKRITNPGSGPATNTYFRNYRASDNFFAVGALSSGLQAKFCKVLDVMDPRTEDFDMNRSEDYDTLVQFTRRCEDIVRSQSADFWISKLRQAGVPCGPFNFPHEVFDEEQIVVNEFVLSLEHSKLGEYKTYGTAIKMEKTPVFPTVSSPGLGEHTTQILEELGYSMDHINQLIRDDVVIQAE